jgi:hypothetical protein
MPTASLNLSIAPSILTQLILLSANKNLQIHREIKVEQVWFHRNNLLTKSLLIKKYKKGPRCCHNNGRKLCLCCTIEIHYVQVVKAWSATSSLFSWGVILLLLFCQSLLKAHPLPGIVLPV